VVVDCRGRGQCLCKYQQHMLVAAGLGRVRVLTMLTCVPRNHEHGTLKAKYCIGLQYLDFASRVKGRHAVSSLKERIHEIHSVQSMYLLPSRCATAFVPGSKHWLCVDYLISPSDEFTLWGLSGNAVLVGVLTLVNRSPKVNYKNGLLLCGIDILSPIPNKHKHKLVGRMLPWGLFGLTAVQYSLSYILSPIYLGITLCQTRLPWNHRCEKLHRYHMIWPLAPDLHSVLWGQSVVHFICTWLSTHLRLISCLLTLPRISVRYRSHSYQYHC
jgi:hypothetical protein